MKFKKYGLLVLVCFSNLAYSSLARVNACLLRSINSHGAGKIVRAFSGSTEKLPTNHIELIAAIQQAFDEPNSRQAAKLMICLRIRTVLEFVDKSDPVSDQVEKIWADRISKIKPKNFTVPNRFVKHNLSVEVISEIEQELDQQHALHKGDECYANYERYAKQKELLKMYKEKIKYTGC